MSLGMSGENCHVSEEHREKGKIETPNPIRQSDLRFARS
jgi:hypothetical protein